MAKKFANVFKYVFLSILSLVSIFPFYWMVMAATNQSVDVTKGTLIQGRTQKTVYLVTLSGTELVLFPAHNEAPESTILAYRNTTVKLALWHDAILHLLDNGIAESDLIYYDGVRHSKPLAGYCGAVIIYGMLYETAPNAAEIGAFYCGVPESTAQLVEDLTMEFIRPYFE